MNAQVATVSNRIPTEPYYKYGAFMESLRRFAEVPAVLGMNEPWNGLMTKAFHYRNWLRAGNNKSDRLILCDAWDIVFSRHPHGIGDRCAELFGDAVVFNGEKGCWPRADLADTFPDMGTPWRYLNCGFICGPSGRILELLESMNLESIGVDRVLPGGKKIEPNDQGEFQAVFAKQVVPMIVDGKCELAQTLSACTIEEFDLTGTLITNNLTRTSPGVFHFNGGSKNDLMPLMLKKWNLPN